jgi:hypothetical protein
MDAERTRLARYEAQVASDFRKAFKALPEATRVTVEFTANETIKLVCASDLGTVEFLAVILGDPDELVFRSLTSILEVRVPISKEFDALVEEDYRASPASRV